MTKRLSGVNMRKTAIVLSAVLTLFIIIEAAGLLIEMSAVSQRPAESSSKKHAAADPAAQLKSLRQKLDQLAPSGINIIIDTARNTLVLRRDDQPVRKSVVSCGSGNVLDDPSGKRTWTFDTPRGEFHVQAKKENPVWIKPDWAFIEEGENIPKNYSERADPGAMGDYAIGIGNGYFIHGTLYTRLLGRNVSHGCVRVGPDDLKFVYERTPIGATVLIY